MIVLLVVFVILSALIFLEMGTIVFCLGVISSQLAAILKALRRDSGGAWSGK